MTPPRSAGRLGLRMLLLLCVSVVGISMTAAPAHAATPSDTIVRVWHPPTAPTLVQGEGLGAVRTFLVPIATGGRSGPGYYMTGTLRTVATGIAGDQELRQANLAFVLGNEADQLIVGGVSLYPPAGSTLAVGQRTQRPIIGGSGRYAGARGYVVTINRGTQGWEHVFHLMS